MAKNESVSEDTVSAHGMAGCTMLTCDMHVMLLQVVRIFEEELAKATSDSDSSLRLWLNMIFASKTDLEVQVPALDCLFE